MDLLAVFAPGSFPAAANTSEAEGFGKFFKRE